MRYDWVPHSMAPAKPTSPAGILNSDWVLKVKLRLSLSDLGRNVDMAAIDANSAVVSGVNRRDGSGA